MYTKNLTRQNISMRKKFYGKKFARKNFYAIKFLAKKFTGKQKIILKSIF